MTKWIHIMDAQPENNRKIVQLDNKFEGEYRTIGFREYKMYCTNEEYLKWCEDNCLHIPSFYWMYYEDFPFPEQKNDP